MQFQAKANVYAANGEKAGVLTRVVIDPRSREVTHLVIEKGLLFKSDKVVPITMVAEANPERVTLTSDAGEAHTLPDFAEEQYVQVGDKWVAPPVVGGAASPMAAGAATAPMLLWYPTVVAGNPVTPGTHVAGEFGAGPAVPAGNVQEVEVERNIPEDTVPLKEGAKVVASDGQHVGNVERVFADPQSAEVTHLLISQGVFLKSRKAIPMAWVLDVGETEVRLAVGSELLQGLRSYES